MFFFASTMPIRFTDENNTTILSKTIYFIACGYFEPSRNTREYCGERRFSPQFPTFLTRKVIWLVWVPHKWGLASALSLSLSLSHHVHRTKQRGVNIPALLLCYVRLRNSYWDCLIFYGVVILLDELLIFLPSLFQGGRWFIFSFSTQVWWTKLRKTEEATKQSYKTNYIIIYINRVFFAKITPTLFYLFPPFLASCTCTNVYSYPANVLCKIMQWNSHNNPVTRSGYSESAPSGSTTVKASCIILRQKRQRSLISKKNKKN